METIYCAIAFTGFSSFFSAGLVKTTMEVFSFVFLLFLGAKFLAAKKVTATTPFGSKAERIEKKLEKKLHPHSAFTIGFVRVMGNVGVLLFWIVIAANLMSHDWVADDRSAKAACVGGVALGTSVWFSALSFGVSRGQGRFSEQTLLRMKHFSGICLLIVGLIHGTHIAWQLAKHRGGSHHHEPKISQN